MEASPALGEPPRLDPNDSDGDDAFAERPEVFVGAAFATGLAAALVLRWLGR